MCERVISWAEWQPGAMSRRSRQVKQAIVLKALLLLQSSLLVGTIVIGNLENWTVVNAWYFATSTITTGNTRVLYFCGAQHQRLAVFAGGTLLRMT